MKSSIWPLSICHTIGWIIVAIIFSVSMTFILATVIVVIVENPKGYTSLFHYISREKGIGGMIAGVATVFSGSFVIVGVFASIREQRDREERDRTNKLKSVRSVLPSVYYELSKLCKKMTHSILNHNTKSLKQKVKLSKSSVDSIKLTLELLRGDECDELFKVLIYYQIAVSRFEGWKLRPHQANNRHLDRRTKNLIIDLVSLQSIAEAYAYSSLSGNKKLCKMLCKNQFIHNMHRYNKKPGQTGDSIEGIEELFGLNLKSNSEFGGYVGFLNKDYFKRYDL